MYSILDIQIHVLYNYVLLYIVAIQAHATLCHTQASLLPKKRAQV